MRSPTKNTADDNPDVLDDREPGIAGLRKWARGQLAHQDDPAITQAWSNNEVDLERELAERIRDSDRRRRWRRAQAEAAADDRALRVQAAIDKADIADLLTARKAVAVQRRMTSAAARLASLYRHRTWSLVTLTGVVVAGMLWSATNVQHNIAPAGATDPLYWFSYLVELMISACLAVIMVGTNKVGEYDIRDDRALVTAAEAALLGLTIALNTYPYWHKGLTMAGVGVHAVPPIMIGVALMIHHAAGVRYGLAIGKQAADLPADDVAQIAALGGRDASRFQPSSTERRRAAENADPSAGPGEPRVPDASTGRVSSTNSHTRRSANPNVRRSKPLPTRSARPVRMHPRLRPTPRPQPAHQTNPSDAVVDAPTPPVDARPAAQPARPRRATAVVGNGHKAIDRQEILRIATEHPSWSNRRIAKQYGCSHSAVDKIFRAVPRPEISIHPNRTMDQSPTAQP